MSTKHVIAFMFLAILAVSPVYPRSVPGQDPPDPTVLESVVDSLLTVEMQRRHIPGGSLVLVDSRGVVLKRGLGYADLDSETPVEPDRTLFGISSISKLFTAAAVLHLVENNPGIAFDDRVNEHLTEVQLADPFDRPTRIADLLTHTGGFDDQGIGVSARSPETVQGLGDYLADRMPPQVMPPGETASYSNHGFDLAGLIVEDVARRPFADYVENAIFAPLAMTRSSFRQPLPPALDSLRAVAYEIDGETPRPLPRIYFQEVPSSAMFTTAGDMGRFLSWQLGHETGERVLSPESLSRMQSAQFTHHPELPGLAFGFWERKLGGRRILHHGGSWQDYSSHVWLVPEAGFGLFVAFNSASGGEVADEFMEAVLDLYLPPIDPALEELEQTPASTDLAGTYLLNRYSRQTLAKLGVLAGVIPEIRIRIDNGKPVLFSQELISRGDLVFERRGTSRLVAVRRDNRGVITHVFLDTMPHVAFERVAWHERPGLHQAGLAVATLLFLGTVVGWVARSLRKKAKTVNADRDLVLIRALALAESVLGLIFLAGVAVGMSDPWTFQYGLSTLIKSVLWIPIAMVVMVTVSLGLVALAWLRRRSTGRGRIYCTAHLAGTMLFLALLAYWNLLGFQY